MSFDSIAQWSIGQWSVVSGQWSACQPLYSMTLARVTSEG